VVLSRLEIGGRSRARHRAGITDGVRQLLTDALALMREAGAVPWNDRAAAEILVLLTEIADQRQVVA
jgi:hypothetical protein